MIENIRLMLNRKPFLPFRIVTASSRFEISDPAKVALGMSQIARVRPGTDRVDFIQVTEVTALEVIDQNMTM